MVDIPGPLNRKEKTTRKRKLALILYYDDSFWTCEMRHYGLGISVGRPEGTGEPT